MCLAKTIYTCQHKEKKRVACRKTWRQRTSWCFRPILFFVLGKSSDEPCDELRVNDTVWPSVACPECRQAEETGIATRGMVISTTATTNKYRDKLTPAALAASRMRKEDLEKQDKVQANYWSRQENFQEELRKRELEEEAARGQAQAQAQAQGGGDAVSDSYADRPLPALPCFPAASVGDTRGDPGYQNPRFRSKNMFLPPPSPSQPAPEGRAPTAPKNRPAAVTSTGSPISRLSRFSQERVERPTKKNYYGRGTAEAIRVTDEGIRTYQRSLLGPQLTNLVEGGGPEATPPITERRGREMTQLVDTYRRVERRAEPRFQPIVHRRPTPESSPEPVPAPKTDNKRKAIWNPFSNNGRRDDEAR
ncbi:hypothetical protein CORC01_03318 [Colletotrichum orchidophilum]|uniref:Uncharacterized protein n=1 Tax=Colletotrichum orchidophilum TaxID=1209926 RepID=A0A1G4BIS4_9PEZI|nr:uncharacterized protein CORC01_03318 [Colletotrichum orchidophilum]OHF01285.1 hypothetical protein CORC01_03318 [Colletotrichum orchidophilum]